MDNEIKAQIDKLRKTRPGRAVEAMQTHYGNDGGVAPMLRDDLVTALSLLRDDLKEEARLVEQAKMRGGTSIIRDRLSVAGWLELFVVQLGRESDAPEAPTERLSPSAQLGEHRPSDFGSPAALLPGPGGRCAVGNVHDEHTVKCPCGYTVTRAGEVEAFLSGAVDDIRSLPAKTVLRIECTCPEECALHTGKLIEIPDGTDVVDYRTAGMLPTYSEHRCPDCGTVVEHDTSNVGCPNCEREMAMLAELPDGTMPLIGMLPALSEWSLRRGGVVWPSHVDTEEQAVHDTIDREYAHVAVDPISTVDPFAPIPRQAWAPTAPPGGVKWTSADLLAPVDASPLPSHLSFSQATTVGDCGAKYRMQRIAKLPQVPQWANVGGRAFHACVELVESGRIATAEDFWDHEFEREIAEVEASSGMVRQQFRASQQGKEGFDWWRVEGAAMLKRYVDWRQGDGAGQAVLIGPNGRPMLEWETTYDVDDVPFKTILDSVWIGDNPQTAIIRDWKTGSLTPDDRQLCTQAWGLRRAGWQGPVLCQFFDARKGTFSEPFDPFERMTWDDVRYFVLGADAQRRLPILAARPSDFCGGCSVAYACPIMAQRKALKVAK